MIQMIGIMIGFYILTRMVETGVYSNRKGGTAFLCWITVFVAVIGIVSLIGSHASPR